MRGKKRLGTRHFWCMRILCFAFNFCSYKIYESFLQLCDVQPEHSGSGPTPGGNECCIRSAKALRADLKQLDARLQHLSRDVQTLVKAKLMETRNGPYVVSPALNCGSY